MVQGPATFRDILALRGVGALGNSPVLVRIHDPAAKLIHAKREIVAARFYEISAEAIAQVNSCGGQNDIYR